MLTPYVKDYDSAVFLRDHWRPGLRCLDAGAGETERKGDWTRIDKYPARPGVVLMDLHHLGFADASFDLITCSAVLQYCEDPQDVLKELYRVLAPGGVCYISVPFMQPNCTETHDGMTSPDRWRFTLAGLRQLVFVAGFELPFRGGHHPPRLRAGRPRVRNRRPRLAVSLGARGGADRGGGHDAPVPVDADDAAGAVCGWVLRGGGEGVMGYSGFLGYVVVRLYRTRRGRRAGEWRTYAYEGWWMRKRDAQREHAATFGETWEQRQARGDRIVLARIEYSEPQVPDA